MQKLESRNGIRRGDLDASIDGTPRSQLDGLAGRGVRSGAAMVGAACAERVDAFQQPSSIEPQRLRVGLKPSQ